MHASSPAALVLALALVVGLGCGIDEDQFTVAVCDTHDFDLLRQATFAEPVDYLELRQFPFRGPPTIVDALGDACIAAADPDACAAALQDLSTDEGFPDSRGFEDRQFRDLRALALTRGDEVRALIAPDDVQALLGTIDAPGDAALMALAHDGSHVLRCDMPAQVGPHADGFVVYTRSRSACDENNNLLDHVVLVRTDGTVEGLKREIIDHGWDEPCLITD
ncbi:MAG: hypothetical protein R3B09_33645 [Nannocystaceae bacterium]